MIEKLTRIVRENTGKQDIALVREMELAADVGLNSLELMELVCEIEDKFEVEIPDRAIGGFKTVGDVLDFIEEAGRG